MVWQMFELRARFLRVTFAVVACRAAFGGCVHTVRSARLVPWVRHAAPLPFWTYAWRLSTILVATTILSGCIDDVRNEVTEEELRAYLIHLQENQLAVKEVKDTFGKPFHIREVEDGCHEMHFRLRWAEGPGRELTGITIYACEGKVEMVMPIYSIRH